MQCRAGGGVGLGAVQSWGGAGLGRGRAGGKAGTMKRGSWAGGLRSTAQAAFEEYHIGRLMSS